MHNFEFGGLQYWEVLMIVETKRCTRCKERKPLDNFHNSRASRDGLYPQCKDCRREYVHMAGRASLTQRRWIKRNPAKKQAYNLLSRAVKAGRITRPTNCERCGNESRLQGHHEDHSKPLEVEWLCDPCHKQLHRDLKQLELSRMFLA